ncbi:MAG: membrane protein insertion efficiency factor YidD [Alphaproteobacteria bacterium]|nr:membrane protein insertion efficiency factor YidD [Alphaproteobacteria bacterium]
MVFLLRALIWLYRHSLSLFLGRQCRFMPTCSAYADEALRIHGAAKGGRLAIKRFCRCHPWGGHGFDPVPPLCPPIPHKN